MGDEGYVSTSDEAREQLGPRWHVQQALWAVIRDTDNEITTWTDACGLTEEAFKALAGAGLFIVREGQAVVDGRVYEAVEVPWLNPGCRLVRPLTEPPPVADEMTTTTTEVSGD